MCVGVLSQDGQNLFFVPQAWSLAKVERKDALGVISDKVFHAVLGRHFFDKVRLGMLFWRDCSPC